VISIEVHPPLIRERLEKLWRRTRPGLEYLDARGPSLGATGAAALVLLLGLGSLATNDLDRVRMIALALFELANLFLVLQIRRETRQVDLVFVGLMGAGLVAAGILGALPEYFGLPAVNAVFHRSALDVVILIPLGTASVSASLYHTLGRTPGAEDLARYPILLVPAGLALVTYAYLLVGLLIKGLASLDLGLLFRPYLNDQIPFQIVDAAGHATPSLRFLNQAGFSNHLVGTLILVALTTIISLPIGVGTGVYLSEYAGGRTGDVIRVATTALRAISPFTIGLAAIGLVVATRGTLLEVPFSGYHWANVAGTPTFVLDKGSFLPAALAISMLVVPVIARATEEGCRSVPDGLREGSIALGASESYTLMRIILPWAVPNVVTATLLGCAEASGALAPVLFIAGSGENGVGVFSNATTLSWAIFGGVYSSSKPFRDQMRPVQYSEGLLLLVLALGLSFVAITVRRRFSSRYGQR
jgi:phosphate transport system permease protein